MRLLTSAFASWTYSITMAVSFLRVPGALGRAIPFPSVMFAGRTELIGVRVNCLGLNL